MHIVVTKEELQAIAAEWKNDDETVAFVPTMGALHEGHLSLVKLGLHKADRCVVSIFVNPAQFLPHEDFESYPREEDDDVQKLKNLNVDMVYMPSELELYPDGSVRDIKAGPAGDGLENDFRPGFFDGVVSVVSRLFEHVQPDVAVFGEKDYQQLCVVRESFPGVEVIGGPTIRDEYGLALSSRNAYLSPGSLKIARKLNKILLALADDIREDFQSAASLIASAKYSILQAGFESLDYLELRGDRLLVAAHVDGVRLIDNVAV